MPNVPACCDKSRAALPLSPACHPAPPRPALIKNPGTGPGYQTDGALPVQGPISSASAGSALPGTNR